MICSGSEFEAKLELELRSFYFSALHTRAILIFIFKKTDFSLAVYFIS